MHQDPCLLWFHLHTPRKNYSCRKHMTEQCIRRGSGCFFGVLGVRHTLVRVGVYSSHTISIKYMKLDRVYSRVYSDFDGLQSISILA